MTVFYRQLERLQVEAHQVYENNVDISKLKTEIGGASMVCRGVLPIPIQRLEDRSHRHSHNLETPWGRSDGGQH